jgi:hypothetical protein
MDACSDPSLSDPLAVQSPTGWVKVPGLDTRTCARRLKHLGENANPPGVNVGAPSGKKNIARMDRLGHVTKDGDLIQP